MKNPRRSKQSTGWRGSAAQRLVAVAALRDWNAKRPILPKCGAKRKHDGGVCRQVALANGRCAWHGGRTPKKDKWHQPRWPNADAPDVAKKLHRKIADLDRAKTKRAARVAKMSDEQRERHEAWHRARQPGAAALRQQAREQRKAAASVRAILSAPRPPADAETVALERQIAALKAERDHVISEQQKLTGAFA
ncbi:hypothetical protein [Mesorhizobium sp. INR15]|uniref:hypothetical protein n=1 Tax=Mesorhizobium sp. INR15 TaxID=2654248 RepID=UPI0018967668|nr:hypothetical protein [Mesorhizobium sp. INR15]QPC90008.1 hypothetical protein GA829_05055 [Mesorhizobium sp. INR15]